MSRLPDTKLTGRVAAHRDADCTLVVLQVERLGKLLGVAGDSAYTCETAAHFWLLHVLSRWEAFQAKAKAEADEPDSVLKHFPFKVRNHNPCLRAFPPPSQGSAHLWTCLPEASIHIPRTA